MPRQPPDLYCAIFRLIVTLNPLVEFSNLNLFSNRDVGQEVFYLILLDGRSYSDCFQVFPYCKDDSKLPTKVISQSEGTRILFCTMHSDSGLAG